MIYLITFANNNDERNIQTIFDKSLNILGADVHIKFTRDMIKDKKLLESYLWRPYIISEQLKKVNFDDYIFYCNCNYATGFSYNIRHVIEYMAQNNMDIMPGNSQSILNGVHTSDKCINIIAKDHKFDINEYKNTFQQTVDNLIIKKTINSLKFVNEWLKYCNIRDCIFRHKITNGFNNCDMAILNVLLFIYKIKNPNKHQKKLVAKNHNFFLRQFGKKILFVEIKNLKKYRRNPSCHTQSVENIMNDARFEVFDIISDKIDNINIDKYDTVCFGYTALYLWDPHKLKRSKLIESIKKKNEYFCKIKNKFFIIHDMHPYTYDMTKLYEFLNGNNINIIFTYYNNNEAAEIRKLTPNLKHYYLPQCVDTKIFTDLKLKKEYDILLYGAIHKKHYPFRRRLFDIILKNNNIFKIYFIKDEEIHIPKHYLHGLAKLINLSKICIATKSKYDYFVGKYLEIPICKSLLAGNMATDGINVFGDNYLELNETDSDDVIILKLKNAIENYDRYENNINKMYNIIKDEYNETKYNNKLYDILMSKL